ncbi:hypothetical protein G4B88_020322 [Cannabis sativa]|uniref:Reverse transcriptase zinc-binding domain-containing protein n=1 Tax=Cannabis sativa TaxID=3483 RepID=A0A7J6EAS8_CANSA|nr:hypothetical protein G4B88_020322 [Cannabis sativa]
MNFIWRVYNHWIPVKVELCKRRMNIDTSCDWCKTQDETLCHALWLCPAFQNIWQQVGFSTYISPSLNKARDVLLELAHHLSKDNMIQFIGLSWLIWKRKNHFVFQNKKPNDCYWIPWALEILDNQLSSDLQKQNCTNLRQIPDHPGCGISAIIRDHNGELIVAETRFIPGFLSVMVTETAAIQMRLDLALRWSCMDELIVNRLLMLSRIEKLLIRIGVT